MLWLDRTCIVTQQVEICPYNLAWLYIYIQQQKLRVIYLSYDFLVIILPKTKVQLNSHWFTLALNFTDNYPPMNARNARETRLPRHLLPKSSENWFWAVESNFEILSIDELLMTFF